VPERILLVRLGALGDIVHAIPVAAALRRRFPQARIDWLVSAKHREILDLVPVVDRRWVINDRRGTAGGAPLFQTVRQLRDVQYDVAVDMQGLLKSAALARASGAAMVVGLAPRYVRESLARFFYTRTYDPGRNGLYDPQEQRHIVAINLGLLTTLGVENPAVEFPIEFGDPSVADEVRREVGDRYALVNPGAGWPNKRWPPDRYGAAAEHLRRRHDLPAVVLWGPGEQALAHAVVAASNGAARLAPPTSVPALVALIRGAAVMISGDTGPTHIAAAVGTPLVTLYGPTRVQQNGPLASDDIAISRYECCECQRLRRCRRASMCLLDIDLAEITSALDRRLSNSVRPHVDRSLDGRARS
jgi:lipopolysaccharide heptosyltransferase I